MIFKEISLLITHYNRSKSLERLLVSLDENEIYFNEIVVTDNASKKEHTDKLKELKERFNLRLLCAKVNGGLAKNFNWGQSSVISPYTLYIQDDFIVTNKFRKRLIDGLSLMNEDSKLDFVQFYAYHNYPYLESVRDGFNEMKFKFWNSDFNQFQFYSDHPHLRRSNFLERFGKYDETISSEKAEFKMSILVLKKKGKALRHEDFKGNLIQKNTDDEPSTITRRKIRQYIRQTNFFPIRIAVCIYRNIKFRLQYLFI